MVQEAQLLYRPGCASIFDSQTLRLSFVELYPAILIAASPEKGQQKLLLEETGRKGKRRARRKVESEFELNVTDIDVLLTSLKYSRTNITDGTAPYDVKLELERLEKVMAKLRALRDDMRENP